IDAVAAGDAAPLQPVMAASILGMRDGMIELYRVVRAPNGPPDVTLLRFVESPTLPHDTVRASADRLAERAAISGRDEPAEDELDSGGVLVRDARSEERR